MTKRLLSTACAALAVLVFTAAAALAQDVQRITKEELKARLGGQNTTVLDVRTGSDWKGSDVKIPGAVRPDLDKDVKQWARDLPKDKEYVLYCA